MPKDTPSDSPLGEERTRLATKPLGQSGLSRPDLQWLAQFGKQHALKSLKLGPLVLEFPPTFTPLTPDQVKEGFAGLQDPHEAREVAEKASPYQYPEDDPLFDSGRP